MWKEKIKNVLVKQEQIGGKKKIENLVVFIIILIITIVAINFIWNDNNKSKETKTQENNNTQSSYKQLAKNSQAIQSEDYEQEELETKIENILSKINGVGETKVLVTYSQSSELVAMYNETAKTSTTKENDAEGGERNIEESDITKEIIYQNENGVNVPVTQTVVKPKIEGVIVTAIGAGDITVKSNIIQAVEAVTGVATHKIQVFEMNK